MVRPRAFAVLRLTIRFNLLGFASGFRPVPDANPELWSRSSGRTSAPSGRRHLNGHGPGTAATSAHPRRSLGKGSSDRARPRPKTPLARLLLDPLPSPIKMVEGLLASRRHPG